MAAARGFTLLEVLVALIIAAAALIALSHGAQSSLTLAERATRLDQAISRAQSHLDAAVRGRLFAGEQSGDDGGGFHWRLLTRALATQPGTIALYDVSASLSWHEGRQERSLTLATQAIGPASPQ